MKFWDTIINKVKSYIRHHHEILFKKMVQIEQNINRGADQNLLQEELAKLYARTQTENSRMGMNVIDS